MGIQSVIDTGSGSSLYAMSELEKVESGSLQQLSSSNYNYSYDDRVLVSPALSRSRTVERDITEDEEDWEKWHGMEAILPDLKKAINRDPKTGKVNGWAALSVTRGPDDILEKLKGNLDITSIISGLLLTVSVPYLSEPPASIDALPINDWRKNAFVLCIILSVTGHLCSLFIASALVNSFNTAARNSDFFRLIIKAGMVPTMSYMTYCGGNTFLACAIAIAMESMYNRFWAIFFITIIFLFCISTMLYLQYIFNKEAHIVHGWANGSRGEEYDLNVPMEILEHYAYLDKESRLHHEHLSSTKFSTNNNHSNNSNKREGMGMGKGMGGKEVQNPVTSRPKQSQL